VPAAPSLSRGSLYEERVKLGLQQLARGVTIVASGLEEERRGLTATAVCSVSLEPPTLLVCVNRLAEAHRAIIQTRAFCVNVLRKDQLDLCRIFSNRSNLRGSGRFRQGEWTTLETGAPVLCEALAAFDCVLEQEVVVSTHSICIGRIVAVDANPLDSPLIHLRRHFGGFWGAAVGVDSAQEIQDQQLDMFP
jgi:flavin reductase (DIM6/NTAB) family NADH-FMN oxidoreductase RutF